jgi:hypothetical protein
LLVNLNEDQWPEGFDNEDQWPKGFDPRGRTLDVVVPAQRQAKARQDANSSSDQNNVDENVRLLATRYGLSIRDASNAQQRALEEKIPAKDALLPAETATVHPIASKETEKRENKKNDKSRGVTEKDSAIMDAIRRCLEYVKRP